MIPMKLLVRRFSFVLPTAACLMACQASRPAATRGQEPRLDLIRLADQIDPGPVAPLHELLPVDDDTVTLAMEELSAGLEALGIDGSREFVNAFTGAYQTEVSSQTHAIDPQIAANLETLYFLLSRFKQLDFLLAEEGAMGRLFQMLGKLSDSTRDTAAATAWLESLRRFPARATLLHRHWAAVVLRNGAPNDGVRSVLFHLATEDASEEKHHAAVLKLEEAMRRSDGPDSAGWLKLADAYARTFAVEPARQALAMAREEALGDGEEVQAKLAETAAHIAAAKRYNSLRANTLEAELERIDLLRELGRSKQAERELFVLAMRADDARPYHKLAVQAAERFQFDLTVKYLTRGSNLPGVTPAYYDLWLWTGYFDLITQVLPRLKDLEEEQGLQLLAQSISHTMAPIASGLRRVRSPRGEVYLLVAEVFREAAQGQGGGLTIVREQLLPRVVALRETYPPSIDIEHAVLTASALHNDASQCLQAIRYRLPSKISVNPTIAAGRLRNFVYCSLYANEDPLRGIRAFTDKAEKAAVAPGILQLWRGNAAYIAGRQSQNRALLSQAAKEYRAGITDVTAANQRNLVNNLAAVLLQLGETAEAKDLLYAAADTSGSTYDFVRLNRLSTAPLDAEALSTLEELGTNEQTKDIVRYEALARLAKYHERSGNELQARKHWLMAGEVFHKENSRKAAMHYREGIGTGGSLSFGINANFHAESQLILEYINEIWLFVPEAISPMELMETL